MKRRPAVAREWAEVHPEVMAYVVGELERKGSYVEEIRDARRFAAKALRAQAKKPPARASKGAR